MREAELYEKLPDSRVRCLLCAHFCRLRPGQSGICRVRINRDGRLYTLVDDKLVAMHVDPVEKKPFYHVLPGSRSYSIATCGCNFRCRHCQNAEISQCPTDSRPLMGQFRSPDEMLREALATGCASVAYTYTEPTVFFELMTSVAVLAREKKLLNLMVSNGYLSADARRRLYGLIDAANIDLKAGSDRFYRRICGARSRLPVQETIADFIARGIWVEVTTLLIPGYNDKPAELQGIADFLVSLSPSIPWHVTGFFPTYRLNSAPPTPPETIARAREIGLERGLRYVFAGNRPGLGGENSYCHKCGALLLERYGFQLRKNLIHDDLCPQCSTPVAGIFTAPSS